MGVLRSINLLFLGLIVPLGQVASVPTSTEGESTVLARDYVGYIQCNAAQKDKINRAFQDAAVMARQFAQARGSQLFRASPAFTHYFQDDEYDTGVSAMLTAIGQQWQAPAAGSGQSGAGPQIRLNQFKVQITCQATADCSGGGHQSLVITDAKPAGNGFVPQMRFCPQFFKATEAHTKNNLDSFTYKLNPSRRDKSWCKPGNKLRDFEVAGTTVVHELTHLDEAGKRAGLETRDGSAGTEDIYGKPGYPADPPAAARKLHQNWVNAIRNHSPQKDQPPYNEKHNADGYAASVTEWWFMSKCNLQEIALDYEFK